MVTRNIVKNTGAQVNSSNIGVLVHPDLHPATVTSITVDLTYMGATIVPYVPDHTDLKTIETAKGGVYYDGEDTQTIDDVVYYKWIKYEGGDQDEAVLWSDSIPSGITANAELYYIYPDVEPLSPTLDTTVKSVFNVNGDYCRLPGPTELFMPIAGGAMGMISGDYFLNVQGKKIGYVASKGDTTDPNVVFSDPVERSGDYQWSNSGYFLKLFTDTVTPGVGDKAYFDMRLPEFYPQTIKATSGTEPYYDDIDCTVSYSIDGSTFTEHQTALTDENNVIVNIPKYMYLKFSQNVEITEE